MVHLRSSLRTQTTEHNHVAELRARLAKDLPDWRAQVQLCYSLAKELEDLGRYAESFAALEQGASLRSRNTVYDVARDTEIFGAIEHAFSAAPLQELRGEARRSGVGRRDATTSQLNQPVWIFRFFA